MTAVRQTTTVGWEGNNVNEKGDEKQEDVIKRNDEKEGEKQQNVIKESDENSESQKQENVIREVIRWTVKSRRI